MSSTEHEQATDQYTGHRRTALEHLDDAKYGSGGLADRRVAAAQVHATLALAAATTLREYTEPVPYQLAELGQVEHADPGEYVRGGRDALAWAARTLTAHGFLSQADVDYVTEWLRGAATDWAGDGS